jgi:hypothetical protein
MSAAAPKTWASVVAPPAPYKDEETDMISVKEAAIQKALDEKDAAKSAQEAASSQSPQLVPIMSRFSPTKDEKRKYGLIKEEDAANIEHSIFQNMRKSMFKTGKGGMFMFGTPNAPVLDLLFRLYNENIIRNTKKGSTTIPQNSMMIGVAYMDDGNIFITLSEDPREDDDYYKKTRLLFTLLHNTNCDVIYDEEEHFDRLVTEQTPGLSKNPLFPRSPFPYRRNLEKACMIKPEHVLAQDGLLRDTWTHSGSPNYDYDKKFISTRIRVHFIHGIEYLLRRRPVDPREPNEMFAPLKKKANSRLGFHECANGSTCSESKLFSYLHSIYDEHYDGPAATFSHMTGYAAYWLSEKNPPMLHRMDKYNYGPRDHEFQEILYTIRTIAQSMPQFVGYGRDIQSNRFTYFAQLFALPCPGCFLNYENYITNTKTRYDLSTCVKSRKNGLLYTGGGYRKRFSRRNDKRATCKNRNKNKNKNKKHIATRRQRSHR